MPLPRSRSPVPETSSSIALRSRRRSLDSLNTRRMCSVAAERILAVFNRVVAELREGFLKRIGEYGHFVVAVPLEEPIQLVSGYLYVVRAVQSGDWHEHGAPIPLSDRREIGKDGLRQVCGDSHARQVVRDVAVGRRLHHNRSSEAQAVVDECPQPEDEGRGHESQGRGIDDNLAVPPVLSQRKRRLPAIAGAVPSPEFDDPLVDQSAPPLTPGQPNPRETVGFSGTADRLNQRMPIPARPALDEVHAESGGAIPHEQAVCRFRAPVMRQLVRQQIAEIGP